MLKGNRKDLKIILLSNRLKPVIAHKMIIKYDKKQQQFKVQTLNELIKTRFN